MESEEAGSVPQPHVPGVIDPNCGTQRVFDVIADKWKPTVLCAIRTLEVARYSELQRQIPGITHKMLTQTLRGLEAAGLIDRRVYPVVPPKVEYRLTPLGASLHQSLRPLLVWGRAHLSN
ncbi:MAG: helix-turn-helix transcriptional regulator, partial [Kutzneria sp.]|nr:helix-turn-helix transcriptional regulator [Kutzneria sp.]